MGDQASMAVSTYAVKGMTCEHCVQAVTREVANLDGVSDVTVDLATGRLTVTASGPVSRGQLAAAVNEAGYELVDATS
jgi:copper chaperone